MPDTARPAVHTIASARATLRQWLRDLSPELRRRISAAGVEVRDGRLVARVALLPGQSDAGFPECPLPVRFEVMGAFRRLGRG